MRVICRLDQEALYCSTQVIHKNAKQRWTKPSPPPRGATLEIFCQSNISPSIVTLCLRLFDQWCVNLHVILLSSHFSRLLMGVSVLAKRDGNLNARGATVIQTQQTCPTLESVAELGIEAASPYSQSSVLSTCPCGLSLQRWLVQPSSPAMQALSFQLKLSGRVHNRTKVS